MDLLSGLLLITSIHVLAAASPGPDFVLVSQQTLANGRKSGFMCSIGIALGLSIHIIYSALGLAAVIANSITALWVIKILGGCYLLYLGYKGITTKVNTVADEKVEHVTHYSSAKSIVIGFLCNALNPKAPIYFVALFTLVLSPNLPLTHLIIYGLWMMIIQLAWFSAVVGLLSQQRVHRQFKKMGHWIDRILGGAMIALGIKVISTSN